MTRNSISHLSGQGTRYHAHADRQEHDYYATPPKALEVIIDRLQLDKNVWECACGGGHLSKVLEDHGHNVKSTDLYYRGYGVGGVDFLKQTEHFDGDILTNPPYKYAQEFVEKAMELTGGKVVMFLKVQFLEGIRRRDLFRKTRLNTFMLLLTASGVLLTGSLILKRRTAAFVIAGSYGRRAFPEIQF